MPSFFNDSPFPATNYGTAYLPVTGTAVVNTVTGLFLAENITITQPSTKIELRNHLNEPAGKINIPDFEGGTTVLQVSGSFPPLGSTFGFNGTVYYFDEVGRQYAQGDIFKAQVNFAKKYN